MHIWFLSLNCYLRGRANAIVIVIIKYHTKLIWANQIWGALILNLNSNVCLLIIFYFGKCQTCSIQPLNYLPLPKQLKILIIQILWRDSETRIAKIAAQMIRQFARDSSNVKMEKCHWGQYENAARARPLRKSSDVRSWKMILHRFHRLPSKTNTPIWFPIISRQSIHWSKGIYWWLKKN